MFKFLKGVVWIQDGEKVTYEASWLVTILVFVSGKEFICDIIPLGQSIGDPGIFKSPF